MVSPLSLSLSLARRHSLQEGAIKTPPNIIQLHRADVNTCNETSFHLPASASCGTPWPTAPADDHPKQPKMGSICAPPNLRAARNYRVKLHPSYPHAGIGRLIVQPHAQPHAHHYAHLTRAAGLILRITRFATDRPQVKRPFSFAPMLPRAKERHQKLASII